MAGLVTRGLRTICFTKSRKAAELVHRFTAERVDRATAQRLAPYRAGYTPEQRREIERRLVEGDLLGVSATDALELGIDIGLLDCAISVGFPGTVASLRQQWGRAGRRGHGLALLICSEDALDQFFAARSRSAADAPCRGCDPRPRQPADPRAACVRRRLRGSARRGRTRHILGSDAIECAAALPELERTPAGLGLEGTRLSGRTRSRCGRETARRSRSSIRRRVPCSASSSGSAPTRPFTTERSTSISASSTTCATSTSTRAPRSSRRSPPTGTRR